MKYTVIFCFFLNYKLICCFKLIFKILLQLFIIKDHKNVFKSNYPVYFYLISYYISWPLVIFATGKKNNDKVSVTRLMKEILEEFVINCLILFPNDLKSKLWFPTRTCDLIKPLLLQFKKSCKSSQTFHFWST